MKGLIEPKNRSTPFGTSSESNVNKADRMGRLMKLADKMELVIDNRSAIDPSGLLIRDKESLKFDAAFVREYRAILKQAAEEAGDRPVNLREEVQAAAGELWEET